MRDNESSGGDPLKVLNFCLLFFVLLNGVLCTFLITYQARLGAETLQTLKYIETRLETRRTNDRTFQEIAAAERLMIGEYKIENEPEFPPGVTRNTDPVSVLNNAEGTHTVYECATICKKPPINRAALKIKEFNGTTWEELAESKQAAKQSVAYKAIEEKYPDLLVLIYPPYVPEVFDPKCKDPEDGLPDPPLKKC